MSTMIDHKIVKMSFDNKNFQKNVQSTVDALSKLKSNLKLDNIGNGLNKISSAFKNFNLFGLTNAFTQIQQKFGLMEVASYQFMEGLVNTALNAGKRITAALTIDPIKTGFQEYETQINSVQTILANTESKGSTLQDVNRALAELNTYADKTIYNFTEMTRNIGTFTAAGIDLNTSVNAIQGIANLAAVSGSTSQQASTAMYQLSQALSSGTVKLMDWNSVVNAGMGGQVFQDALKDTARVHGVNVDAMIEKNGSFRESLQEGWITSEILTKTLEKFTLSAEEGTEQWEAYKKSLMQEGYTEAQAKNILKMANTATDAATKVKTFTQLFDTLKESAQSGWTQTWELIVGDFGEAKNLLTNISDVVGGAIGKMSDARNELIRGGLASGWKQLLSAGIADEEGFKETLMNVTKESGFAFDELIKQVEKDGGTFNDALKKALKDGNITSDTLTKSVSKLSEKMQAMSDAELKAAGYTKNHVLQIKELDKQLKDGTLSMDDFVKKMSRSSGRENIIEALSNAFSGFTNIIKEVGKAWREVFPALQSEQLYNFTVKIKDLTAEFKGFTEKYAPKFKSTFKGIFDVVHLVGSVLKSVVSGIVRLLGSLKDIPGIIVTATGALGEWVSKLVSAIDKTNIFESVINGIVKFLQNGIDGFKAFCKELMKFESVVTIVKNALKIIESIFSKIGEMLKNSLRSGDITAALDVFNTGLFSGILLGANKFIKSLSDAFGNIGDTLESASGMLNGLKDVLKAYQQEIKSKVLLNIAKAVAILAGSIFVLSLIDPEQLGKTIAAMALILTELMVTLNIFMSKMPDGKRVFKACLSINTIASSLLIMAVAAKILSSMKIGQLGAAMVALGFGVMALVKGVNSLEDKDVRTASKSIKHIASALVVLSVALKIMGSMDIKEMGVALAGAGSGVLMFVSAVNRLPDNTKTKVGGLIALATSLVIFAGALKIISSMNLIELGKALGTVAIALTMFVIATNKMPDTAKSKLGGLIGMAIALTIFGGALKIIGNIPIDKIAKGLGTIALALLGLVAFTNALPSGGLIGTAFAISIMSASLVTLGAALLLIGSMKVSTLAKAILGIAGALLVFGGIAYLLAPLTPVLLAVSGAFALFGVAVLGIGAGLSLVAAGIAALSVALAGGVTAIVAGVTAIVLGVFNLVPDLIKTLGYAIVLLCGVIMECAPLIAETILVVVADVMKALAEYSPQIVDSLMTFLISVLDGISARLPELLDSAIKVLKAFFEGIIDAIGKVDTGAILQIVLSVGVITLLMSALSAIAGLVPYAMLGVLGVGAIIAELALVLAAIGGLSSIPGLSELIEDGGGLLEKIGNALGKFVGGIAGGIAEGFTSSLPNVAKDLSSFITELKPFIDGVKGFDESTFKGVTSLAGAILALTGANLLSSITSFISGDNPLTKFAEQLVPFGKKLKEYSIAVEGIKADPIIASAKAAKELAKMADVIPNEGGMAAWFAGENSIADFADKLPTLGKGIKGFSDQVADVSPENVVAAAKAAKKLAEIADSAPAKTENMYAFGETLATFGSKFKLYFDKTNKIDPVKINDTVTALSNIKESVTSLNAAEVESASRGLDSLVAALNSMSKLKGDSVSNFALTMQQIAGTDITNLLKTLSDAGQRLNSAGSNLINQLAAGVKSSRNKIKSEFDTIIKLINTSSASIRELKNSFYNIGSELVNGFVKGITENAYKAEARAEAMALLAKRAAEKALKIKSPSRVFYSIGSHTVNGFVNALSDGTRKVYNTSINMAQTAKDGMNKAITKVTDLLNSNMDTQPVIQPVLDLSNIQNGASLIGGMFSDVGIGANLNAINYGMNARLLNNTDNNVVSALDRLRKDLNNNDRVVNNYSINGVSYDENSNIASAMETIIRAAIVDRRV